MSQAFTHVAVFGKPRAEGIREPLLEIARVVESAGGQVMFDLATAENIGSGDHAGHTVHACKGSFIFGIPGETIEDCRETLKFALELSPHCATFYAFDLIPG